MAKQTLGRSLVTGGKHSADPLVLVSLWSKQFPRRETASTHSLNFRNPLVAVNASFQPAPRNCKQSCRSCYSSELHICRTTYSASIMDQILLWSTNSLASNTEVMGRVIHCLADCHWTPVVTRSSYPRSSKILMWRYAVMQLVIRACLGPRNVSQGLRLS